MNAAAVSGHYSINPTGRAFPRMIRRGLLSLAAALLGGALAPVQAADYTFTTLAGVAGQSGSKNGAGGGLDLPLFNGPNGLVATSSGNLYVADASNNLIRLVTADGVVTTFAGTRGYAGGTDGAKTDLTVSFNSPQGPALDAAGNLYVADYSGSTIRKITPAGTVTTFAGSAGVTGSADGTGTAARFLQPSALAIDASGNVYVADSGNHTIRKITSAGVVTTLAGGVGVSGAADGTGTAARFKYPRGLAVDAAGNLYVADSSNNLIRKVTPAGVVTTVAGLAGTYGSTDGQGADARFNFPSGIAVDTAGGLVVADEGNHTIRLISAAGQVTTLAGLAGTAGRINGTGTAARFAQPAGVTIDSTGNILVADYGNNLIRRVTRAGVVTTVAGVGGVAGATDGTGYRVNPSMFKSPSDVAVNAAGTLSIADTGNHVIRVMTSAGVVTTLAGEAGSAGISDGTGTAAHFFGPSGVAVDAAGNTYVADTGNHLIRKVTPAGVVTTVAGRALVPGSDDGAAGSATFNFPSDVAVDAAGAVYVADYRNHAIRKIAADGTVSTLAGAAGTPGSVDGAGANARFNFPRSLALDAAGNLYVADSGNHTIRKITSGGFVTTLAGSAGNAGSADGAGASARFNGPAGLAVDAAGNVFVTDTNNSTVRLVTAAGQVTTLGGLSGSEGRSDGIAAAARFNHPNGVAVNAKGTLYITDTLNHTLRKGAIPGSPGDDGVTGIGGDGSGNTGGSGNGDSSNAGGSGNSGTDDGSSTGGGTGPIPGAGLLLHPTGMTIDTAGNYYVTDTANNCIRKISTTGVTSVFVGKENSSGSTDGTGTAALFNGPTGITTDFAGNFYVCDTGNATIRKVTTAGVVTTLAGSAGTRGSQDGDGTAALFNSPTGIAYNSNNTSLYVTDSVNCTIRKITASGTVTTLAGTAKAVGDADGVGAAARFNNPTGLSIDSAYTLYVADTYNNTIRKVTTIRRVKATAVGTIGTAGTATVVLTDAGLTGSPLTFNVSVAASDDATAWAAKVVTALQANTAVTARYTVVSSGGIITLTYLTSDDGTIANLSLANGTCTGITDAPTSVATAVSGTVTTLAGSPGISGVFDGTGPYALFNLPRGVAVDGFSNVYVADTGNSCIRKITSGSVVTTLAGIAGISGFRDGAGGSALFNQPQGIFAYSVPMVVDTGNSVIRAVATNGSAVSSLALSVDTTSSGGSGGSTGSGGGGGGGAPSLWFVAILGALGGIRRLTRRAA